MSGHLSHEQLVNAGYRDQDCITNLVAQLGVNDHHKRSLNHIAHKSVAKPKKAKTDRRKKC